MWEWLETIFGVELILVLFWVYVVYAFGAAIFIILDNRPPSSTFAWLFLFILLPLVGVLIYLLFGRELRPFSHQGRLARVSPEMESALTPYLETLLHREDTALQRLRIDGEISQMQSKLAEMLRRTNLAMLTIDNRVELLQDAQNTYPRLEEDIRNAQHSIHMEYFTWMADDYTWKMADLLIEKAQAGVEVRILYDALGSYFLDWRHRGYVRHLRQGGVEIYSYLNRFFLLSLHAINYRNHRKITVIDGHIAYAGGLNMGQEHLDGAGPYNAWRDTHLRIVGEAAAVLQGVFVTSWYNTTYDLLTDSRYFAAAAMRQGFYAAHAASGNPDFPSTDAPAGETSADQPSAGETSASDAPAPHAIARIADSHQATQDSAVQGIAIQDTATQDKVAIHNSAATGDPDATSRTPVDAGIPGDGLLAEPNGHINVPVQIVGSGPDSQWYAIQQLYFSMIPLANKHVYIQSPFFIPDTSVGEALKASALAGIDVRIMCARRDTINPLPNWAANTYFDEMARAGVKIYLMQSAYLHSKTISIDSAICSIGSANMDLRSFQINYELNAVLYNRDIARELEAQFHKDLEDCLPFDDEQYRRKSNLHWRLRDSLARLVSPLL